MLPLDVTRPGQHRRRAGGERAIDVLVNNAGVGAIGAFEATPMGLARDVFDTNTFGVMAMTQAVLPQMRERRSGVVVNVTSSVALAPMPLVAIYTASKMAIEGFTASLARSSTRSTCASSWSSRATARRHASPPTPDSATRS